MINDYTQKILMMTYQRSFMNYYVNCYKLGRYINDIIILSVNLILILINWVPIIY